MQYAPAQANAPPDVETLTDAQLVALRERCSAELGRRSMTVATEENLLRQRLASAYEGLLDDRKRHSDDIDLSQQAIRELLKQGQAIPTKMLVSTLCETQGFDTDLVREALALMAQRKELAVSDSSLTLVAS